MNIDEFVTKEQFDEIRTVDNFDNNAILNKRWNRVDELLSTFYTKNQKINRKMYDNLQSIFDGIKFSYEDLYNYASVSDIAKLRRKIDDVKDEYGLDGYVGYRLNQYLKRKKLTNNDILMALILMEYYKQLKEQVKEEKSLFDEIKNVVYKEVYEETLEVTIPDKEERKKKIRLLTVPEAYLLQLIALSSFNGYLWSDYKEGNVVYNSNKLLDKVKITMQQGKELSVIGLGIKELLEKQNRAYLNKTGTIIKKSKEYHNVFSGALDNQLATIVNKITLQAMKNAGVKRVQFIAEIDDKTTKMCKSLNLKVFYIDKLNKYIRYSDVDKKNIVYETFGLETGANLPPINNHFHYCRSTIIPFD